MDISHLTDSNCASEILFDCLSEGMRSLFMMKNVIFLREFIATSRYRKPRCCMFLLPLPQNALDFVTIDPNVKAWGRGSRHRMLCKKIECSLVSKNFYLCKNENLKPKYIEKYIA